MADQNPPKYPAAILEKIDEALKADKENSFKNRDEVVAYLEQDIYPAVIELLEVQGHKTETIEALKHQRVYQIVGNYVSYSDGVKKKLPGSPISLRDDLENKLNGKIAEEKQKLEDIKNQIPGIYVQSDGLYNNEFDALTDSALNKDKTTVGALADLRDKFKDILDNLGYTEEASKRIAGQALAEDFALINQDETAQTILNLSHDIAVNE